MTRRTEPPRLASSVAALSLTSAVVGSANIPFSRVRTAGLRTFTSEMDATALAGEGTRTKRIRDVPARRPRPSPANRHAGGDR
jgi:hypothetical protein